MIQEKTFKGIDLIDKILEFIAMTPDENEWNYRALDYNKPRLIRLQRIDSLLKAFSLIGNEKNLLEKTDSNFNVDLKSEIKSILSGKFLEKMKLEDFGELIDFAKQFVHKLYSTFDVTRTTRYDELIFIYPKMMKYKIKLREITNFNSGWLEASSTFAHFHISLVNSINANLIGKFDELDKVLELYINPKKLIFTEDELIKKFNYPTDDLDEIDMDNW